MIQKQPNTIIIGGSKCGTTALFDYFEKHDQIFTTEKKELHFHAYASLKNMVGGPGDKHLINYLCSNIKEYTKYFTKIKNELCVSEFSPSYLYFENTSTKSIINTCGKDVKIIVLVRNPVEKIIAQYSHLYSAGRETFSFDQALGKEKSRKSLLYSDMWLYRESGFMSDKIKYFKDNFKNVLVINSADLKLNKKETLTQIFNFVNVEPSIFDFSYITQSNVSGLPKSQLISKILIKPNYFTLILRKIVPTKVGRLLRDWINRNNKGKKAEIDVSLKKQLFLEFKDEISSLNHLIDSNSKIENYA